MDELFVGIRLQLVKLRQSDPEVVEELKSLLSQVEDSVESLIIDSLKLKSLEQAAKMKKAPREKGKQSK